MKKRKKDTEREREEKREGGMEEMKERKKISWPLLRDPGLREGLCIFRSYPQCSTSPMFLTPEDVEVALRK